MSAYRVGYMAGDGIGPEIMPAARRVADAALAAVSAEPLEWVDLPMGASALVSHGSPMPASTQEALATCDGWVIGPHDSQSYPASWHALNQRPPGGQLRHHFDLYANLRPSRSREGIRSLVKDVDLVIVRENTEGFYADRNMHRGTGEFMPSPDVALVVGVFTRAAIERVAEEAFRLASTRRRHVTAVTKSNVVPMAFGLWMEVCRDVAARYPDVELDEVLFDAMTAHLVRHPQDFDVLVMENMFGDALSDLAGELTGSLGLSASLNASADHAMAQAAHGSAPDIAGQNKANPVGAILSTAMLLEWLSSRHKDPLLVRAAAHISSSVDEAFARGIRTKDLGGEFGTREFADGVCAIIAEA